MAGRWGATIGVAAALLGAPALAQPVVASYYAARADAARVETLPTASLTHLIYAFVPVCADPPKDRRATGGCPDGQPYRMIAPPGAAAEAERAALAARRQAQGFKMIASVGGWGMLHYPGIVKTEASRAAFVASAVDFLKAHPEFDGVDIDWEFPGGGDEARPILEPEARAAERDAHRALVLSLRTALDDLGRETGRKYLLTAAVVGYPRAIASVAWPAIGPAFDQLFVMTYDFTPEKAFRERGDFSGGGGRPGHHTNLHAGPGTDGYGADAMIAALAKAGAPKDRMVIGAGFYAREWKAADWKGGSFPGSASGGTFVGPIGWKTLMTRDLAAEGLVAGYDTRAQAAYYASTTGGFLSLDTPRSICAKGAWARKQGLAGIFAWEAGDDDGRLTQAMVASVGPKGCVALPR